MGDRDKEFDERLDCLEKEVKTLQIMQATNDERMKTIFNMVAEIKQMIATLQKEVETIKAKPTRLWDGAMLAIIASVVGYLVSQVFK